MTTALLDGGSDAFLRVVRESGGKPLFEQTMEEARAQVAASSQMAVPAEQVHSVIDRQIPSAGGSIGVRVYTPRPLSAEAPAPMVLHFHGAGFVAGNLDTHDAISRYYCRHADAIVVSVDYRLAPEHKFPAGLDDCWAAVEWAVANAGELNGDPARLAVTGDSAGGNLSAVVSQLAKARGGPTIALQALVYPWVDVAEAEPSASRLELGSGDYFLSLRDLDWCRTNYLTDPATEMHDPRVSPIASADLSGLAAALIVTAGVDPLRDEAKLYADRLAAAGVPVEYRCFEGTIHACMSFGSAIPAGAEMLAFVASRLNAALHPA